MNYGALVFLAAFLTLATSWFGFVLAPQLQLGRQLQETNLVNSAQLYPQARPGLARQGLQVYRANGCAACHTEQVGQTGTVFDVVLTKAGTNQPALTAALVKAGLNPNQVLAGLPKTLRQGIDKDQADTLAAALKDAGAAVAVPIVPVGPDIPRWGQRRTVAADYLYDDPVMPGSQRVGPDLANVGMRSPDANWHLRHLYAPGSEVKGSLMPPYRYLFQVKRIERQPSPDALHLAEGGPPSGYEIVPRPEATALVAYLLSLRSDVPLFEAPMTVASAPADATATNAPAK